jgi:hypothetical protein
MFMAMIGMFGAMVPRFSVLSYLEPLRFPIYDPVDLSRGGIRIRGVTGTGAIPVALLTSKLATRAAYGKVQAYNTVRILTPNGVAAPIPIFTSSGYPLGDPGIGEYWVSAYLYVTLSGLSGDFAILNGSWVLSKHVDLLLWSGGIVGSPWGSVQVGGYPGDWTCRIRTGETNDCYKYWKSTSFRPDGVYTEYYCTDLSCLDSDTCTNSVGATCVVYGSQASWWDE